MCAAGRWWWLRCILGPDLVIVDRDMDRVDEKRVLAAEPVRLEGEALLVEHGRPRGFVHDAEEDLAPELEALLLLRGIGDRVGLRRLLVQVLVAVFRPAPAAVGGS